MLLIFWDIKEKPATRKAIEKALGETYKKITLTDKSSAKVIFIGSKKIRTLNRVYRKIDKETDVLSFAELDLDDRFPVLREEKTLGEIYINLDWVAKDKNPTKLASALFLHGYLHLLGYDHEKDQGEMEKLEKKLNRLFSK